MSYKYINIQYNYKIPQLNFTIYYAPEYSESNESNCFALCSQFVRVNLEFGFAK